MSSLDCHEVEHFGACDGDGCCLVKDHADNVDYYKVKSLFYKLFWIYLKENCCRDLVRPMPVLLGDGQYLDLYKLFSIVKERGGYVVVSKKRLWGYVIEELGLKHRVLASVKLVYDKYLNDFEEWLMKAFEEKNLRNGNHGCDWGFKSLLVDLEKDFRGLLYLNLKEKDDELVNLETNRIKKYIALFNHKGEKKLWDTKNQNTCENVQSVHSDDDEKISNGVKDGLPTLYVVATNGVNHGLPILNSKSANGVKENLPSLDANIDDGFKDDLTSLDENVALIEFGLRKRKRKREPLSGMLNWIRQIAKSPLIPLKQPMPKPPQWKEYKGEDFFIQLLRTREARLVRSCVYPSNEQSSSQKLKMHPTMYDDHVSLCRRSIVKLRCNERMPTSDVLRSCSCCNSCSSNGNKLTNSVNLEAEKCPLDEITATVDPLTAKPTADQSSDDFIEKQVSIGPLFQAEVPEWTDEVSESDSKWLGTQVWPPEHNINPSTETDLVGRGRPKNCSCSYKGSVECVRFHIAENRMTLRHQLGSAFYHWGFDRMGEEISLQWTIEEEKRFKNFMMSNIPSLDKSFWSDSSKYFPDKSRRRVVSYYFNVYLIQLRSYQNRVTPKVIDSDDDEAEFGSFSDGFGVDALKGPTFRVLECSENKQCIDLD